MQYQVIYIQSNSFRTYFEGFIWGLRVTLYLALKMQKQPPKMRTEPLAFFMGLIS